MSSIICLISFVLTWDIVVSLSTLGGSQGSDGFKLVDGSLYLVTPELEITEAIGYCERQNAQLAYPRTEKETNDLAKLIKENYPNIKYIAIEVLRRKNSKKNFHNYYDYDNYGENEQELFQEVDEIECGAINAKDGKIEALPCFSRINALCRKKVRHDEEMCNTTDIHFEANTEKTACHKFYFKPLNWTDAKELCEKEDAHLAVINSQEEAELLLKLHSDSVKMYRNQNGQLIDDTVLWLGFTYSDDKHQPLSIFGNTLEVEGYSNWATAKGDSTKDSQCGSMGILTGFLKFTQCHETHSFACKKPINATLVAFDDMKDRTAQFKKMLLMYFRRQSTNGKKSGAIIALCLLALCICTYIGYRIKIGDTPATVRTVLTFFSSITRRLRRN